MVTLLLAAVLVLIIWALASKQPALKTVGRIFTGSIALLSAAGMVFLFGIGQKAHWTSDGPGMVIIMAGILFCGFFALLFGGLFYSSFKPPPPAGPPVPPPPPY
jgi:hypothetical protein